MSLGYEAVIDLVPFIGLDEVNRIFEKIMLLIENGKVLSLEDIENFFGVKSKAMSKKFKLDPDLLDYDSMLLYESKDDGTKQIRGRRIRVQGFVKSK